MAITNYSGNVLKGGVATTIFGHNIAAPLWSGQISDAAYLSKTGIFQSQKAVLEEWLQLAGGFKSKTQSTISCV